MCRRESISSSTVHFLYADSSGWNGAPGGSSCLEVYTVCTTCKVCEFGLLKTAVPYGCETWLLTLREKSRMRVFQNRVWRRIFGPKRDMVIGEWRKLHNEELNDLY